MVNNSRPLKALVVGCGSIGKRHLRNLCANKDVGEIYVLTKVKDCLDDLGRDGKKALVVKTVKGLKPDFALICNATHKHVKTALKLAGAGVHLFIEKPVSNTLSGTASLSRLAGSKRIKVLVGYNMRFLGAMRFLKKELEGGRLGKLYFADIEAGQYLPFWRPGQDYRIGYSARRASGGGVSLDLSHEIDYMRFLFGEPVSGKTLRTKVSDLEIDSDDLFEGLFTFRGGMICRTHMDYLQKTKTRIIKITGSRAAVTCDFANGRLSIARGGKTKTMRNKALFDMQATYKSELNHFIDIIRHGGKSAVTLADGIAALKLIEARHV